jgi:hypothetical protein
MDNTLSPLPATEAPEVTEQEKPDDETAGSDVESKLALGVAGQHDVRVQESLILGGVVAGNDLTASESGAGVFVAGGDVQLEEGGALIMVVGGDTHLKGSGIGVLVAGGDVHLDDQSQILMTSQHALIIGAVAGAVFALLSLIFARRKKT